MTATKSLRSQLDELHGDYVESINHAIAEGADHKADELASDYDQDAIEMVARYENKTHLLPISRPVTERPSMLRRLFSR